MARTVNSREAAKAKAMQMLSRPVLELESATDAAGNLLKVGDTIQIGHRTTTVTRIYQEPTSTVEYDEPAAEVTNSMVGAVVISQVVKAN